MIKLLHKDLSVNIKRGDRIKHTRDIAKKLPEWLSHVSYKEYLMSIYLDKENRIIDSKVNVTGGPEQCGFSLNTTVQEALMACATVVVIVHNHGIHPTHPSKEDISGLKKLAQMLFTVNILLGDFIIVGTENDNVCARSLLENGYQWKGNIHANKKHS